MKPKRHLHIPEMNIPLWWPSLRGAWRGWLPSKGNVLFTLLVVFGLLWANNAGAVPFLPQAANSTNTIAYQGRLANASGNPITAVTPMVFRLYNAATGGAPLWEENWVGSNSVNVSDGLFNVMLGSLSAIPQSVVTGNSNLWLGITVNADSEMQPRVQLGTVPFAVQALTVPNGSITAAKLAPGLSFVPPDGSITTAKLADGAVTSRKMRIVHGQGGGSRINLTANPQMLPNSKTSFTVDVPSVIIVTATFDTLTSSSGSTVVGNVAIDDTLLGRQALTSGVNTRNTIATSFMTNIEPGAHTISLSAWASDANSKILDHSGYTYVILAR